MGHFLAETFRAEQVAVVGLAEEHSRGDVVTAAAERPMVSGLAQAPSK